MMQVYSFRSATTGTFLFPSESPYFSLSAYTRAYLFFISAFYFVYHFLFVRQIPIMLQCLSLISSIPSPLNFSSVFYIRSIPLILVSLVLCRGVVFMKNGPSCRPTFSTLLAVILFSSPGTISFLTKNTYFISKHRHIILEDDDYLNKDKWDA